MGITSTTHPPHYSLLLHLIFLLLYSLPNYLLVASARCLELARGRLSAQGLACRQRVLGVEVLATGARESVVLTAGRVALTARGKVLATEGVTKGVTTKGVTAKVLAVGRTVAAKIGTIAVHLEVVTSTVAATVGVTTLVEVVAILGEVAGLVVVVTSLVLVLMVQHVVGLGNGVGLALDLGSSRDVGALFGRANREDRALPLVTLAGELAVLGSLGANATRERNVRENAVFLGHGDIDLFVLGS